MYYAEAVVNGIWHYKSTPRMDWKPMSVVQLNNKIAALEREILNLKIDNND